MYPLGLEEAPAHFRGELETLGFKEQFKPLAPVTGVAKFGDSTYRKDHSTSVSRLFLAVTTNWNLSVKQTLTLAGGISKPTYDNWRRGKVATLSRDQFERVSLILGIHKALRLIFVHEDEADRWFKSPNFDDPFGRVSPLDYILAGGIQQLYALRSYLDTWRGIK